MEWDFFFEMKEQTWIDAPTVLKQVTIKILSNHLIAAIEKEFEDHPLDK